MFAASSKPVLQFIPLPAVLNPDRFANARSNDNPNGDLRPLFAFRNLVDPLPNVSTYFTTQGTSTEDVYGMILNGAVADGAKSMAAGVLADGRKRFAEIYFHNMDGTPGEWRPVYAEPSDWYNPLNHFQELDIDLGEEGSADSPYTIIGGGASLRLLRGNEPGRDLDRETKLRTLRMKCLLVTLRRPWLYQMLFRVSGWHLPQQPRGFCSSGLLDANDGAFPLLPTAILLAKDLALDATWSKADRDFIDKADGPVSLGPFPIDTETFTTGLQVVAWISALTPLSPEESG